MTVTKRIHAQRLAVISRTLAEWIRGALAVWVCISPCRAETEEAPETVRFNRDVLPILADHCHACHGPDKASRKAGLRLDRREAAVAELESGERAIVPGDAAKS